MGTLDQMIGEPANLLHRELDEAWNHGDFDCISELYTDDVVFHHPSSPTGLRGPDAYASYVESVREAYPGLHISAGDIDHIDPFGRDRELLVAHLVGTSHRSESSPAPNGAGNHASLVGTHVFQLEDGRIQERWGGLTDRVSLAQLEASTLGEILLPGDAGYKEARTIWNGMTDKYPSVIVRCEGAADVIQAVKFARSEELLIAVKGGGHNVAGNAICHGGIVIDLEPMTGVVVSPEERTLRAQPGVTWRQLIHEAQQFGLVTPGGVVKTTGIAGLTLGGGYGFLSRKHGLTADNLLEADIVTADGELLTVNEDAHADLFWGIRGGGGNFGIVTSFTYELHEVGPEIFGGALFYDMDDARETLQFYREFIEDVPNELTVWAYFPRLSAEPYLPPDYHGEQVFSLVIFHPDPAEGQEAIQPILDQTDPISEFVIPMPYSALHDFTTKTWPEGVYNYWRSNYLSELSDGAIDTLVEYANDKPSSRTELILTHMEGAIGEVGVEETAYPHREEKFINHIPVAWGDPRETAAHLAWADRIFEDMQPYYSEGAYVNFLDEVDADRVQDAYLENFERLVALKDEHDPQNHFRNNQNIPPSSVLEDPVLAD